VSVNQDAQVVKRKCPSSVNRNLFEIVDTFTVRKDAEIKTSLTARLPSDMRSLMLQLTNAGCPFDMVWASGVCSDPSDLNQFDRLEVFEGVFVASYEHDAVGTFDDTEIGDEVFESVQLSVVKYFDFATPDVVNTITLSGGAFTDIVYCPATCAVTTECTIQNQNGCSFPFATAIFPGDPDNQLNLYYSTDGGVQLSFTGVDASDFTDASVSCFAGNVIIGHNGTASDYYFARQADILSGSATFYAVGSGSGLKVGATDGGTQYLLGNGVYYVTSQSIAMGAQLVINSAGTAMNAMSRSGGTYIAVGDGGNIERIRNNVSYQVSSPTVQDLVTVDMITSHTFRS